MQGSLDTSTIVRMKDAAFLAFMGSVIAALRGNALFSGPWPSLYPNLDELTQDTEAFRSLYNASLTKDVVIIAQKNAARKALNKKIFRVSQYVELVADDDPAKLLGTGFSVRGHVVHHNNDLVIKKFTLANGPIPGSVYGKCARTIGAGAMEIQVADDPSRDENFKHVSNFTRCSKMEMYGFESVKKLYFRIRALGHDVKGPWAPVVSIVVL